MRFYKSMRYKFARFCKIHAAAHDLPKLGFDSKGSKIKPQDVVRVVVLRRNLP